jgi:adenosylcobinamide-GDP ribazoletransferase
MNKLLTQFRSAVLFITILPAGRNVVYTPVGMIKFFPLVGLVLGGLLVVMDQAASQLWSPCVAALLDVFFLVVVTGAFHLDGLGDTADGVFSHQSKQRALEIMKDSRTGMMGLVAVFCVLALKIAGIYSIKTTGSGGHAMVLLLIVPAYSRAAMIFGIRFLSYGRKQKGTGLDLFERPVGPKDFSFFLIPVVISCFLGYNGLVLNGMFILTLAGVLMFYKKKLGCITGDMLGALTEIMETVLFLSAGAMVM